jgi:integrase
MEEIKVRVNDYGNSRNLVMLYFDPVSGKRVTKSTGTTDPGEAERFAGEWEKQLRSGLYQAPSKTTWQQFRERYEKEHLATLAPGTQITAGVSLDTLERGLNPDRLIKLTTAVLSQFSAKLRQQGMKDTTLARTLRHIKAALRWAERVGLMPKAPKIDIPKRVKGQTMMRGRPITGEEFDRMIEAVSKVRPHDSAAWVRYLTGLWLSGLRLAESLKLSWEPDAPFSIDLTGRRPVFRIYGEAQKSGRDQLLPMTPDFVQWLEKTFPDKDNRQGRVFELLNLKNGQPLITRGVGEVVSEIGQTAGVVVNKADDKYATAHDLRRSFGTRWAPRVKPATLQLLMRHADIGTTMKYYVAQDAADVADELWAGFGPKDDNKGQIYNKPYNTCPVQGENEIETADDTSTEPDISQRDKEKMRERGFEPRPLSGLDPKCRKFTFVLHGAYRTFGWQPLIWQ